LGNKTEIFLRVFKKAVIILVREYTKKTVNIPGTKQDLTMD